MRIYKDLNMVEQLGSGVPRILKAYSKDCFKFSANYLRMTFPLSEPVYIDNKVDSKERLVDGLVERLVDSQKKIVDLILKDPNVSKKEMSEHIGISRQVG